MKGNKLKTRGKKKLIFTCTAFILVGCSPFIYVGYKAVRPTENVSEIVNTLATQQTNTQIIKVFTAARDIQVGEFITSLDFIESEVAYDSQNPDLLDPVDDSSYIQDMVITKALVAGDILQKSDLVPKSSWYEEGDRLVEISFVDGAIPTIISSESLVGSLVDIRLFRKGAEDLTVISKVMVTAEDGNKLGFHLNNSEIDSLKEASTEMDGLYLVFYLDESQKESPVTYKPSYSR